jgi:hypothetical protein
MYIGLTLLTIISGVSSILGFAYIFFGKVTFYFKILCMVIFVISIFWSIYVLLVPGSSTESNVASKFEYFRFPSVEKQSETLLIQRGKFTFSGTGPISIEFPLPFLNPPEVEVINFKGYDSGIIPRLEKVTANQVVVGLQYKHLQGFPITPVQSIEFRWVARGIPLEEVHIKK